MKQESGQFRFTSILISGDSRHRLYRSMAEMPPESREALLAATKGERSATILIADEAGERFLQEVVRTRLHETEEERTPPPAPARFWQTTGWRWTVELAICSGAAFLLWFLATLR